MDAIPILDAERAVAALRARPGRPGTEYFAFYSSLLGGIVTDPALMVVPFDDHLVHRGDGVFETMKCVRGGIYLWREHLARLMHSAKAIGLASRWSEAGLEEIVRQTLRAGGRREALVRVILARGPGSMGVNPYDCPEPALYVLAHALKPSFMDLHPSGARLVSSTLPVKAGFFATIKSCNYLPNALLKKFAVDSGADFAVCYDEQGHLAEGATENVGIVDAGGRLRVPAPDRILAGTTMNRACELAERLVSAGMLKEITVGPISRAEMTNAREILIFGTTPDVTSVVEFDGKPVGGGVPGPIGQALRNALLADMVGNPEVRLEIV